MYLGTAFDHKICLIIVLHKEIDKLEDHHRSVLIRDGCMLPLPLQCYGNVEPVGTRPMVHEHISRAFPLEYALEEDL